MQKQYNNFDCIRLLAAIAVWYHHSYELLGVSDPLHAASGFESFGTTGVAVFFIISGYFITASYDTRKHLSSYMESRALRIFPALVPLVLLTVFVLGPNVTSLSVHDYFHTPLTWNYLKTLFIFPTQYDLPGVFQNNPFHAVNGSLWTLKRELRLYIIIGAVGALGLLRPRLLIAALVCFYALRLSNLFPSLDTILPGKLRDMRLESLFFGGSVMYLARNHIALHFKYCIISLFLLAGSFFLTGAANSILFDFALTYLVVYVGFAKLPLLPKLTHYGDFSYGFYLYAFPIQQILIRFAGTHPNFPLFLYTSFFATFLCAALSWHFIEKPALSFKQRLSGGNEPVSDPAPWCIMATKYTLFIAHLLAQRLRSRGLRVDIVTQPPKDFPHQRYIVICAQMFPELPPSDKRIVFQLEQCVASRWFTEPYLNTLKESLAILEYSLVNIDYLTEKGIDRSQIHYLPVGACPAYGNHIKPSNKKYDILFYGSMDSPHRKAMLTTLKKNFRVKIVRKMYADDIIRKIKSSRLVMNIHYYNNALLEMPRIQECLSLGVPLLSECSQDMENYPELSGAVKFFKSGCQQGMVKAVESALKNPVSSETIAQSVATSGKQFAVAFDRFLDEIGIPLTA